MIRRKNIIELGNLDVEQKKETTVDEYTKFLSSASKYLISNQNCEERDS